MVDTAVAAAFVVVGQAELFLHADDGYHGTAPHWVNALTLAPLALCLAWRRSHAWLSFLAASVVIAVPGLFVDRSMPFYGGFIVYAIAAYSASRYAARALAMAVPAVEAVTYVLLVVGSHQYAAASQLLFFVVTFGGAWLAGQAVRRWQTRTQVLHAELVEIAVRNDEQTRLAVAHERSVIARELHDIVAHSVSVMVVQASSARLDLREEQASAREALLSVEAAGRQALVEMRRLLGLLRDGDAPAGLAPTPGLSNLDALVHAMGESGLTVTTRVEGNVLPVDPGVGLAAFRIVQEALTNVLKHVGPTTAEVVLRFQPDALRISVDNEPGAAAPYGHVGDGGHGLIGMRERVAVLGGQLRVGPASSGGFRVDATLPLSPVAP